MSPSYAKINQEWRKRGENPEFYLQTYNAGHQWYFTYNELRPLSYCWYWVEKIMTKTKKMRISSRGWKKRRSDEEETGADDEHHDDDKPSHTKMDESGRRRWCWSKLGEDEEDISQLYTHWTKTYLNVWSIEIHGGDAQYLDTNGTSECHGWCSTNK